MPGDSTPLVQLPTPAHLAPRVYLENLDHLWFQLTGTLCNLTCTHCFISCSPDNRSFGFLDYERVIAALEESKRRGSCRSSRWPRPGRTRRGKTCISGCGGCCWSWGTRGRG